MQHKQPIYEVFQNKNTEQLMQNAKKYFKWIVISGIVLVILAIVTFVLLIIGLFKYVISPLITQGPNITDQGNAIFQEGQKWWEERFNQETQQLQQIQTELHEVKKIVEDHNKEGSESGQNQGSN